MIDMTDKNMTTKTLSKALRDGTSLAELNELHRDTKDRDGATEALAQYADEMGVSEYFCTDSYVNARTFYKFAKAAKFKDAEQDLSQGNIAVHIATIRKLAQDAALAIETKAVTEAKDEQPATPALSTTELPLHTKKEPSLKPAFSATAANDNGPKDDAELCSGSEQEEFQLRMKLACDSVNQFLEITSAQDAKKQIKDILNDFSTDDVIIIQRLIIDHRQLDIDITDASSESTQSDLFNNFISILWQMLEQKKSEATQLHSQDLYNRRPI